MNRKLTYPIELTKQNDGGYLVEFPDIPEAITQGDTIDDALIEASDCLEETIANRIAMKMTIPDARQLKGYKHNVSLPATLAAIKHEPIDYRKHKRK